MVVRTYPRWDFSKIDHRGHWVPRRDDRHPLSDVVLTNRYLFERETENLSDAETKILKRTRGRLRAARVRGYLDAQEERYLNAAEIGVLSEACRCEGIPVVADYPSSMRAAIISYGELLASLFFINPFFQDVREYAEQTPERMWASRLARVLRILGQWRITKIKEVVLGFGAEVPIQDVPGDPEAAAKAASEEIDAFNLVTHEFPNLLQSFLTLGDHLGLRIPNLRPVHQPTTEVWAALDVTSENFLEMVRAQPAYFQAMSGHQFEKLVAQIFRQQGFEVLATKQSRDGGFDLRIVAPLIGKLKTAFLVECKNPRKGGITGVSVIRGLKGIADDKKQGTAGGIVVTSTAFSDTAREEARASGWNITLFERSDLLEMLSVMDRVGKLTI